MHWKVSFLICFEYLFYFFFLFHVSVSTQFCIINRNKKLLCLSHILYMFLFQKRNKQMTKKNTWHKGYQLDPHQVFHNGKNFIYWYLFTSQTFMPTTRFVFLICLASSSDGLKIVRKYVFHCFYPSALFFPFPCTFSIVRPFLHLQHITLN